MLAGNKHKIDNYFYMCLTFSVFVVSSWDLVFKFVIQGFSVRIVYLLGILLAIVILGTKRRIKLFPGYISFTIWLMFIAAFIPNTTFISRNIGYFGWLVLSGMFLFMMPVIINNENFEKFYAIYLWSFYIMGIIGIIQFLLGIQGISFYTRQWWIYNKIPRLNGFSYEPSYYGTYLMIGWSLTFYHFINKHKLKYVNIPFGFYFLSSVIVLSSSRMSIAVMLLVMFLYVVYKITGYLIVKGVFKIRHIKFIVLFLIGLLGMTVYSLNHFDKIKRYLSGIGIGGTSTHSTSTRFNEMKQTFEVFLQSPIIGCSLGGIPSKVGWQKGFVVSTQNAAKQFEGMNVFLEVLAASGIIGFLFFLLFILSMIYYAIKYSELLRKKGDDFYKFVEALLLAFITESILLMFNQNILRPYYWLLMAMLNSAVLVARYRYNENTI